MANFETALQRVLQNEGGYVNDPGYKQMRKDLDHRDEDDDVPYDFDEGGEGETNEALLEAKSKGIMSSNPDFEEVDDLINIFNNTIEELKKEINFDLCVLDGDNCRDLNDFNNLALQILKRIEEKGM